MDLKQSAAIATIVATVIAVISVLGNFGGFEQVDPLTSVVTGGSHTSAIANGQGSNANVSVNNSATIIDNRISVEENGVAIGSGANINLITKN